MQPYFIISSFSLFTLLTLFPHPAFSLSLPQPLPQPQGYTQQQQQQPQEYTQDNSFRDAILNVTNTYRKQHNATSVQWNETLVRYAAKWIASCTFKHSGGPYGENLASGYPNASASVIAWGEERKKYDFRRGDFGESTGHFTQLVWKGTTQVGCARKACDAGQQDGQGDAPGWYVACEYSPAGNMLGDFKDNVQAQVSSSSSGSSAASGMRRSDVWAVWAVVMLGCVGGIW